jgi:hypothetical protein
MVKINSFIGFFMFLVFLLVSCEGSKMGCERKEVDNDWKRMNLNGRVKRIDTELFEAVEKFGKIEAGSKIVDTFNYGGLEFAEFNEFGNLVKNKDFGYEEHVYFYESQRLVRIEHEDLNGSSVVRQYVYGVDGRVSEWNDYCNADKCDFFSAAKGDLLNKTRFKYDNSGRMIVDDLYSADGNLLIQTSYSYPSADVKFPNVVEVVSLYYVGGSRHVSYKSVSDYKRDELGNEVRVEVVGAFGGPDRLYLYQYLYDEKKNWFKKVTYRDSKLVSLAVRKIVYYD